MTVTIWEEIQGLLQEVCPEDGEVEIFEMERGPHRDLHTVTLACSELENGGKEVEIGMTKVFTQGIGSDGSEAIALMAFEYLLRCSADFTEGSLLEHSISHLEEGHGNFCLESTTERPRQGRQKEVGELSLARMERIDLAQAESRLLRDLTDIRRTLRSEAPGGPPIGSEPGFS